MAQRVTCDCCGAFTEEAFPSRWGHFWGYDPQNQTNKKDLCPTCTVVVGNAIVELRKYMAPKGAMDTTGAPGPVPTPGGIIRR